MTPDELELHELEQRYREIVDHENDLVSYDPDRVDRSLAAMRVIARRIAYLRASPERRAIIDQAKQLGFDLWP